MLRRRECDYRGETLINVIKIHLTVALEGKPMEHVRKVVTKNSDGSVLREIRIRPAKDDPRDESRPYVEVIKRLGNRSWLVRPHLNLRYNLNRPPVVFVHDRDDEPLDDLMITEGKRIYLTELLSSEKAVWWKAGRLTRDSGRPLTFAVSYDAGAQKW